MTNLSVRTLGRDEMRERLDDIGRLRLTVFRNWPYLYDGTLAYENDYLQTYLTAEGGYMAGAFDGDELVGATTASPLVSHDPVFSAPFADHGLQAERYFYLGESVLLPRFRGQGIGVRFFDLREREATRQGFDTCVFCAVERLMTHSARPPDYQPLDRFWQNRGYAPIPGIKARFAWKDIDSTAETEKSLQFWHRKLAEASREGESG